MYGSGGYAIRNIPRVIVSLQDHVVKLEDVKSFVTADGHSPSGLMRNYLMPGLTHFRVTTEWYKKGDAPRPIQHQQPLHGDEADFVHEE